MMPDDNRALLSLILYLPQTYVLLGLVHLNSEIYDNKCYKYMCSVFDVTSVLIRNSLSSSCGVTFAYEVPSHFRLNILLLKIRLYFLALKDKNISNKIVLDSHPHSTIYDRFQQCCFTLCPSRPVEAHRVVTYINMIAQILRAVL